MATISIGRDVFRMKESYEVIDALLQTRKESKKFAPLVIGKSKRDPLGHYYISDPRTLPVKRIEIYQ